MKQARAQRLTSINICERRSTTQAEGKEPPSLGSGGPSHTAIGLTPIRFNSVMAVPTGSMVSVRTTVPTISRRSDHHWCIHRVGRSYDDRGRHIHSCRRRTWRRDIHHRRCWCANHWWRTEDRQTDVDAHSPARPGRTGESETQADYRETDESFRFHTWSFDGWTLETFRLASLIEFRNPDRDSMEGID